MELPRTFHNRLSYAGTLIAVLSLVVFGFLLFFHAVSGAGGSPYAGIVLFVLVPAFILLGVLLVPIGMLLEWRRVKRTGERSYPPALVIDLNIPRHRNMVLLTLVIGLVLVLLSSFGGYEAYETTESVAFCGQVCHTVMEPEYTAYQHSPHARVPCVDCHVGSGPTYYLRAKVTGMEQAWAVAFDSYPRPIPSPIESLRPARETCEQCHWPDQFFGEQHRVFAHYLPDASNTRWRLDMRVKTGGGLREMGRAEGIHWHMNRENKVEYFARDDARQKIPWIRATGPEGDVTVYASASDPPTQEEIAGAEIRTMDCMDCHNRPAHTFVSPRVSVNRALEAEHIARDLPFVKQKGVELLATEHPSREEGLRAIEQGLRSFYEEEHPQVAKERSDAIDQAVGALQDIYRRNQFPYMKVRWDTYPDNLGHLDSAGCARCHDADHESSDGRTLERGCDTCHLVVAQGPPGDVETDVDGLAFRHPVDIGGAWQFMPCSDCHSGAAP